MSKLINLLGFVLVAGVLLSSLSCSKKSTNDDADADKTPPPAIADLGVILVTSHSATLRWTTPTDYRDDHSTGIVDRYDIRVSYDSITPQNVAAAYSLDSVPGTLPAGMVQDWEVDGLEPDSQYYFAVKSCDDKGNWSAVSNCCKAHCTPIQTVAFADTSLDHVIRAYINKPTGDFLSSDVDSITFLSAGARGIVSLSGLEYCTSLHAVFLGGNEITDLAPLQNLEQIGGMDISINHISNISPLAGMIHMGGLNLAGNEISDLSPLASMTELTRLDISMNPVTNISTLASFPYLQQLFMHTTQVTDFSPLYGLEHLDDVHFATLQLTDISFMSHLTHLKICKLNSNQITSVAPLSGLVSLEGLDLSMNQISDLTPLTALVNIRDLSLVQNQVTDIQALVDNTGLGTGDKLYLGNNPLSQQAVDVQIPALEARGVTVTH